MVGELHPQPSAFHLVQALPSGACTCDAAFFFQLNLTGVTSPVRQQQPRKDIWMQKAASSPGVAENEALKWFFNVVSSNSM